MEFQRIFLDRTSSTNSLVHEAYKTGAVAVPLCIRAGYQDSGRGIGQNTWHSTAGKNLLMSVGVKMGSIKAENQFEITKIVSLSLLHTVRTHFPDDGFAIKWPNDLYWNQKKLAGILISNIVQSREIEYSVIGIGLNVNEMDFPASLPNPVSLVQIGGNEMSPTLLMESFLENFDRETQRFFADTKATADDYLANMLYFNQPMMYQVEAENVCGIIRGVSSFGHLRLDIDGRGEQQFDLKELSFLHRPCLRQNEH